MTIAIGNTIKTLRLARSMTQEQLAQALHVSAQAVSKWELGSTMPDIQLLPELSVVLGTSIDALFSLTDERRFTRIDNMLWDKRFLTQQEFETEERFLRDKCQSKDTRPRATLLLAELYCKRAREYQDLASPLAREALLLNPGNKEAHNAVFDAENGAYLDWTSRSHARTIDFYKDYIAAYPEEHSAYPWLLDLLLEDGRCAEARAYLETMHRLKPSFNDALYEGMLLEKEGQLDRALACWEKMCAQYGDMWQAWFARANALARLGRYEEAVPFFEKALALQQRPRFTDPAVSIAQISEILGDSETAIRYYEVCLTIMREDWNETQGEAVDAPKRAIARLRENAAHEKA